MNFRRFVLLLSVASLAALLPACSTNHSTPQQVTLAFSPGFGPPTSMMQGATAGLAVTITNGSANATVAWTVACSQAQCGNFNPTSTASTVPTTYTAPASVPTGGITVTITATYSGTGTATPLTAMIKVNPPAISVTFNPAPPTSMNTGTVVQLTAMVTNDPSNAGVNWTVTCGQAQCGSFVPTQTASGASTMFTAPTNAATGAFGVTFTTGDGPPSSLNTNATAQFSAIAAMTVTVTATSVTDNTQSVSAMISVVDLTGVNWTVTCGSAGACGMFNPTTTQSGVDTTYTAPPAVPTGNTVTVTATSVTDNTQSKSAQITITASAATLPDGFYVFQLSGQDGTGVSSPFYVAGAFHIASGAVDIDGEEDFNDFVNGASVSPIHAHTSTVTKTADGNLQIVLDTGSIGNGGLETLNVTMVTPTSGLVTWFDSFAAGSGTITQQNSAAASATPAGGYALLLSGVDPTNVNLAIGGIPVATAGVISGFFDVNDGGAVTKQIPFAATSNVSAPDTLGRVTFTLDSGGIIPEIVLAGYIVDAGTIAVVESSDTLLGATGGTALSQGANTGTFTNSNLFGNSYVPGAQGGDIASGGQQLIFAGSLTFNADGSVSGNATFNDLVNQLSGSIAAPAGSASIDATGRVTVSNLKLTDTVTSSTFTFTLLQMYLDGNGNAGVASMDGGDVVSGPAFLQTTGASFVTGSNYALSALGFSGTTTNAFSAAGPINFTSGGNIGAGSFTDYNYFAAASPTTANVPLTGTASSTSGTITGLNADTPANSNTFNFYLIDNNHAFGIESDATQLGLIYMAHP